MAILRIKNLAAVSLIIISSAIYSQGLDPSKSISQYIMDKWDNENGLPQNSVYSVIQSSQGYIWAGTQEGFVRFDGISFKNYNKRTLPQLKHNYIFKIVEDKQKRLWIATNGGGILKFENNQFVSYSEENGFLSDFVFEIFQDSKNNIWFGSRIGVIKYENGKFINYTALNGEKIPTVSSIIESNDGAIYIATESIGIFILKNEKVERLTKGNGLPSDIVQALFKDKKGNIWIGTNDGLLRYSNGNYRLFTIADGLPSNNISTFLEDRFGSIWIGTKDKGISRYLNGRFENYGVDKGLPNNSIISFCEDVEGSMWIGTNGAGLLRFKNSKFISISTQEGLPSDFVWSVAEDKNKDIWVSTHDGGVAQLRNGKVIKIYTDKNGLPINSVRPIIVDRAGRVWLGTNGGGIVIVNEGRIEKLISRNGEINPFIRTIYEDKRGDVWIGANAGGLVKYSNGAFSVFNATHGLVGESVRALIEDRKGVLWVGTNDALNKFENGKFTSYTKKDGLESSIIRCFYEDNDGVLWIGTDGAGLIRLKNNKFFSFNVKHGMPDDLVFTILEDNSGNFWMSCNKGVYKIGRKELNDYADGKISSLNPITYGKDDGMKNPECNGGANPSGIKASNGSVWIPTMGGIVGIDPNKLFINNIKPNVIIEEIIVDGERVELNGSGVVAPAGAYQFEFHFTGLSMLYPNQVKFKYKLEGLDSDWNDAGTRRTAYYTNISPGEYKFRVIACNNDGIWNEEGATISFKLNPFFYQTIWFYLFCIVAIGFIAYKIYQYRLKKLKENEIALNKKIDEMMVNLRAANQKILEEKESVELKVEEAVKQSEFERKYLANSVDKILKIMDKVAEGDLTVQLDVSGEDAIAKLYNGFNKVIENLRNLVGQIVEAVNTSASSSAQISASSEEMDAGAQMQAVQVSEAQLSISEMTKTILETAKSISQVTSLSKSALESANKGGSIVNETITGMNKISEVMGNLSETIEQLGKSGSQIGDIIQVIDEIADQTNLLALNAAIEAARAGEHGRGFAIVADEVRKLAERTTKATKEIASMIKTIQNDTTVAIESMQKGSLEVDSGKKLSNNAGEALKKIIDETVKVEDIVNQVAAASEEQSVMSESINENMIKINNVTRETTDGIHQIAKAADSLSMLAENMKRIIMNFKLQ